MENIYVKDIVSVTGGKLLCGREDTPVFGLAINSKEVQEGDLFVPIIGENVDAHRFIEGALQYAAASFTQEHTMATEAMVASGKAVIFVESTLKAMQEIGAFCRKRLPLPVVGVTGSVGKTTTREMIYTALSAGKFVFQTEKNYNSQIGVPLTLAKLSGNDEIAVLEMGMSNPGEMKRLAYMIRPDTAVVTCIGVAHIEQLKTQDNICNEKLAITTYMKDSDTVYLNGDDPILRNHAGQLKQNVIFYGTGEHCQYQAQNIRIENGENVFDFKYPSGQICVRLKAMGQHNVLNATVALAVAMQYGIEVNAAARALYDFQGQRQKIMKTSKFTMIDDTYNASPDSMKAALKVLHDMPCNGRRIAVLADMLELGKDEITYHEEIGYAVKENGIDTVVTYGPLSAYISKTADIPFYHADSLEDIVCWLDKNTKKEDIVLFKGSNGMKLSTITGRYTKEK